MLAYKFVKKHLCKPPQSMKGDYRYAERKYLNMSILCQALLSYVPAIISIFVDINYNSKRAIFLIPFYLTWVIFMYLRWYKTLTVTMMLSGIMVTIHYWMSVDKGIVLFTPFFFLIYSATFVPSRNFLVAGYIFAFSVSYFVIEKRLMDFLQTAPREEIVNVFKKSFTTMLQILSISFCHLLIGRSIQQNVYAKLLALKATVATQNQELQKVNHDLTKALESRESFILSFSHETRNPLNGIIGNLHLLSEVDLNSKKAKEYLQKANICAKILNNILLTILDSRRTGQSAIDIHLKPQTLDMSVFIREVWTLCREIIRSKDVLPILDVSPKIPRWLMFDPERITQVVMNLISNATKFTQKGYIKLSFDWKPDLPRHSQAGADHHSGETPFYTARDVDFDKQVEQKTTTFDFDCFYYPASEEKGQIVISVEDTGCGISEAHQKVIFEKFSQVNENTALKNLGLGLGLWIAKAIINLHGGDIHLRSKERLGSCFTGSIRTTSKLVDPTRKNSGQIESSLSIHKDRSSPLKRERLKALVVEDFPINQNINSEMLKKYGFTDIEIAADGQEGVNMFKEKGPNYFELVTMDLEMPVMKGKEAIKLIRKWESENGISPTKIVVISGNAVEKEVNECLDSRGAICADAFLTKPCSYQILAETITRLEKQKEKEQLITKRKNSHFNDCQISSSRRRLKVLFADDDFFNLDILIAYAQKMNLEYLAAKNGEEAYRIFEEKYESIGLIFLDFNMPLMSGPETCDKIRKKLEELKTKKKCKIFLLSGMNKIDDGIHAKFDGIVHKPLTFEEFEKVVLKNIS